MKIIQISSYYPPHLGGLENVAKEVSERLAKKDHQIEVFTSNIGCQKDKQLKSTKKFKINYLPAKEIAHTPLIPSLYEELMKIPQDSIMHVHVAQAYVPEVVYKVCKKRNIPYIAHLHADVDPSSFLGKVILNSYKNIFLKRFLKNAAKIIVLTEGYKDIIIEKYSIKENNIIIIPNGTREEFFINKKRKNLVPHLLFVGRISTEKNIPILIESVELCKSKFVLDIVGDGELLDNAKNLVRKKELKNVIFHGRKNGNDLIKMYQNSDVLILPSKKESFGLVLLEAMASKTSILASDIPGIREIIKDDYNGILINPNNSNEIAKAMDNLIKNTKLRERLTRNGLKEVKKYSWDKIVEQTEKVYEEVLRNHNKKLKQKNK